MTVPAWTVVTPLHLRHRAECGLTIAPNYLVKINHHRHADNSGGAPKLQFYVNEWTDGLLSSHDIMVRCHPNWPNKVNPPTFHALLRKLKMEMEMEMGGFPRIEVNAGEGQYDRPSSAPSAAGSTVESVSQ